MVGWHHQLNGHEFDQTPVNSEGQGGLVCCSPGSCKESDTLERLNNNNKNLSKNGNYWINKMALTNVELVEAGWKPAWDGFKRYGRKV